MNACFLYGNSIERTIAFVNRFVENFHLRTVGRVLGVARW